MWPGDVDSGPDGRGEPCVACFHSLLNDLIDSVHRTWNRNTIRNRLMFWA